MREAREKAVHPAGEGTLVLVRDESGSMSGDPHSRAGAESYSPIVKALEVIEGNQLRADVLVITDAAFGDPPDEFTRRLAEVKQRQPLRVVSVVIGADDAQASAFSDRVVRIDDLLQDRSYLANAISQIL